MDIYVNYIISLLKSAILGTSPSQVPEGIDLEKLFKMAKRHSVANILYNSLIKLDIADKKALSSFEQEYARTLYLEVKQQYYLEMVCGALEKNNIRYIPMKGIVIKPLYPSPDMRLSGDLDIFVDEENCAKVKQIMEGLGFATKVFNESVGHDEYIIDNAVVVEIHRKLVSNKCPWDEKCQEITDRVCIEEPYQYRYKMSDEDYYLYMIAHMAKHMKYSGAGIKMVLDVWVFLRHYADKLDMDVLNERLKYCGLDKFDARVRALVDYWFNDKEADELAKKLADYVMQSGSFGTHKQLVAGEMAKNAAGTQSRTISTLSYYIQIFFMPYNQMKESYPVLKKLPVLLPFLWVYRACKTIFFKKEKAQKIKNRYKNADMQYGKELVEFKKQIGL